MSNIVTAALDGTGNVTQVNSGANNLAGTAGNGTYVTTGQIEGTSYMQVATAATLFSLRWDYTAATTAWHTFYYLTPAAGPATAQYLAEWRTGTTTKVGDLRMNTSALTLTLRDSTNIARATSTALPASAWCRIAIRVTATDATAGHQLRIYTGSNLHGSVPDYDSGSVAVTGTFTGTDAIVIGHVSTGTQTDGFDRLLSDNASEPAGLASGSQLVYPASDVTTTGWTVTGAATFFGALNETSSSDSEFVTSPATPSASVLEVGLGAATNPGVTTGHVLDYRIRTSGAASSTVVAALYQGTTLIASETRTGVPAGFTTFTFNIPAASIAAITNYAALRFRVTATAA